MIMHSTNLDISIQWLTDVVGTCLRSQLRGEAGADVPTPDYTNDGSAFARFIEKHNPTYEEMIVLLMALVPHVQPQFFDKLIASGEEAKCFRERGRGYYVGTTPK